MDEVTLPRSATIKSYPLSIIYQTIRLFIFGYVIIYGIVLKQRYQETDIGYGTVLTKVIGSADTRNRTDLEPKDVYQRVWESTDLVQSFQENGALFITSNAIITPQQQQGNCAEDPFIPEALCTPENATNCIQGSIPNQGNGKMTGKCVPTQFANSTPTYTCEVSGWCPTERMVIRQNMLRDLDDTELFRDCQEQNKRDNLADYDCPVFSLSYMLNKSGMLEDFDNIIAIEGGVLGVTVKWDCDFDYWENTTCRPEYIFRQLDITDSKPTASWDFRDGITYRENGTLNRDLHTVFGIFLIFNTEAMAGKFNPIDTLLELSAAFNLFDLASIVCIVLITYASILKRKNEESPLVDSDMSSAPPQDTSIKSADSAINRKPPIIQKNSSERQHSDDNVSAKLGTSRSVNASHQQGMQANSYSADDVWSNLIIFWFKKCLKKISLPIFIVFIGLTILSVGFLIGLIIIKVKNLISYSWLVLVIWFSASMVSLVFLVSLISVVLWCIPEKYLDSFFRWLSHCSCRNTVVTVTSIGLILFLLIVFLSVQVYFMHYDKAFALVSLLKDTLAAISIDLIFGMVLTYPVSLILLFVKSCTRSCSCSRLCSCSCSNSCSCSDSKNEQRSDGLEDFVEHMHDLKKHVIWKPVLYADDKSGAKPDGAVNNESSANEPIRRVKETPM